ncbi:MAG TPA: hypothetical protein VIH89_17480 [Candidatus Sulfotelmatobacter sp.]
MPWTLNFWLRTFQDPGNVWAMITAITTVALVLVAYWQLRALARTSRSEFLYKLKRDFFTDEARRLIFLAENDLLEFQSADISYFRIVQVSAETQSRLAELGIAGSTISAYQVDDALLGPLEDVGILLRSNLVSLNEAYEQFESYVQICAESKAMGAYLESARTGEGNEDVYDGIQYLYERLEKEGPKIRDKKRKAKRNYR